MAFSCPIPNFALQFLLKHCLPPVSALCQNTLLGCLPAQMQSPRHSHGKACQILQRNPLPPAVSTRLPAHHTSCQVTHCSILSPPCLGPAQGVSGNGVRRAMLGWPPHTALSEDTWVEKKDRRKCSVSIKMSSESIIWYNSKGPFGSAVSILNFPHPGIDTKPIIRYKYKT